MIVITVIMMNTMMMMTIMMMIMMKVPVMEKRGRWVRKSCTVTGNPNSTNSS